jgi:hypothetical protein
MAAVRAAQSNKYFKIYVQEHLRFAGALFF